MFNIYYLTILWPLNKGKLFTVHTYPRIDISIHGICCNIPYHTKYISRSHISRPSSCAIQYNFVAALWVYIFTSTLNVTYMYIVDRTDQTIYVSTINISLVIIYYAWKVVSLSSKTTKNYIHPYTSQNLTNTQTKIAYNISWTVPCELCIRSQFSKLSNNTFLSFFQMHA